MMQTWDTTIHAMLVEACGITWDIEHAVRLVVWAALHANMDHPEWAQAKMLALPDSTTVDKLAAILVNGTPVERMAV